MKYLNLLLALNTDSLESKSLYDSENSIKNKYIVVLKDQSFNSFSVGSHIERLETFIQNNNIKTFSVQGEKDLAIESKVDHIFNDKVLNGYTGVFDSNVLSFIRNQPDVLFAENDQIVRISKYISSNSTKWPSFSIKAKSIQKNSPWGLARITKKSNNNLRQYPHDPLGGKDVAVYVIDTGINIYHHEFNGRARWGASMCKGGRNTDNHGHGTHVAGTIGGKTYGVAKSVQLIAVQVFCQGASGYISDIIRAIEWSVADFKANSIRYKTAILNLSLGGDYSRAQNLAIENAFNNDVLSVVAAGNEYQDACNVSPASSAYALTVGAINSQDYTYPYSNYGRCVNIWAPGQQILSSWIGSNTAVNTITGTSMATPHVAGVAAYYASKLPFRPSPNDIWSYLAKTSSKGYIRNLDFQSPNSLLFLNI